MYILTCDFTPIFVTEIGLPLDVRGALFENQFLAGRLALRDRLNRNIAIGDKSKTAFNLK